MERTHRQVRAPKPCNLKSLKQVSSLLERGISVVRQAGNVG